MGRELHYELELNRAFTPAEEKMIMALAVGFDRTFTWTCDGFNFCHYLNKDYEFRVQALESEGLGSDQAHRVAASEGRASLSNGGNTMSGSSKVRGDNWNAFLIVACLVEISRRIPGLVITVRDEEDDPQFAWLACPNLVIEEGLARPDFQGIRGFNDMAVAMATTRNWRRCAGDDLLKHSYAHSLFSGTDSKNSEYWKGVVTRSGDVIRAWLPRYEGQWKLKHPDQEFSTHKTWRFFVSPWIFARLENMQLHENEDVSRLGGLAHLVKPSGSFEKDALMIAEIATRCVNAADKFPT